MNILDLPVELLQEILSDVIEMRGLKRGLRLRLVNRMFLAPQDLYCNR
jgi:hypothetical protein